MATLVDTAQKPGPLARREFARRHLSSPESGVVSVRLRRDDAGEPFLLVGARPGADVVRLSEPVFGVRVVVRESTREPRHLIAPVA